MPSPPSAWACSTNWPPTSTASTEGGTPQSPVMQAMAETVRDCHVPPQPFRDLIQANRQDQVVTRYPTFGDLVGYCELSANPVGRIVLYVFGAATPERLALSDRVCTALQLAEHWQDVAEDLARPDLPARRGPGPVRRHRGRPGRSHRVPQPSGTLMRVPGAARARAARPGRAAGRHAARRGPGGRGRLRGRRPGRARGDRRRSGYDVLRAHRPAAPSRRLAAELPRPMRGGR